MIEGCSICTGIGTIIFDNGTARILLPHDPHISGRDGGHLIVAPIRHFASRMDASKEEILAVDELSIIAAKALRYVFQTEHFNYQENGNWSVDTPEAQHMHLHVYGRSKNAKDQIFGEALRFPFRSELPSWVVARPSDEEVRKLVGFVTETQR